MQIQTHNLLQVQYMYSCKVFLAHCMSSTGRSLERLVLVVHVIYFSATGLVHDKYMCSVTKVISVHNDGIPHHISMMK